MLGGCNPGFVINCSNVGSSFQTKKTAPITYTTSRKPYAGAFRLAFSELAFMDILN